MSISPASAGSVNPASSRVKPVGMNKLNLMDTSVPSVGAPVARDVDGGWPLSRATGDNPPAGRPAGEALCGAPVT
jgi:hypothetical protein